VKEKIL